MKLTFQSGECSYSVNSEKGIDISIPVIFNGAQPNTYDVPIASATAYSDGNFVGDTRQRGSCNFEEYRIIPHCNGTHTECVGHLAHERISIQKILTESFLMGSLISITPQLSSETSDSCTPPPKPEDYLITADCLKMKLEKIPTEFLSALLIRTLPNDDSKLSKKYSEPPPYFTTNAMQYLLEKGVEHLLVDFPSVDRIFDEGKLTAHHVFWNLQEESHAVDLNHLSHKTITEMIFVPDFVQDKNYIVNIQIPAFVADAAPSRPIIFEIENP